MNEIAFEVCYVFIALCAIEWKYYLCSELLEWLETMMLLVDVSDQESLAPQTLPANRTNRHLNIHCHFKYESHSNNCELFMCLPHFLSIRFYCYKCERKDFSHSKVKDISVNFNLKMFQYYSKIFSERHAFDMIKWRYESKKIIEPGFKRENY